MDSRCKVVGLDSNPDIDVHTLLIKQKIYATNMCVLKISMKTYNFLRLENKNKNHNSKQMSYGHAYGST